MCGADRWIHAHGDRLDFDVVRSHALLFDGRKSGDAVLLDDDGLHASFDK